MNAAMKVFLCLACLLSFEAAAQPADQMARYRLAQGHEQAGDYERAARIYRELLVVDPSNQVYFDGLRRMYLQLKLYDELVALLRTRLAQAPSDINLRGMIGSALFKAGKETEAYDEWERAIATAPASQVTYRVVASVLAENRLLERAIDLYRRARIACNDPTLFTIDLAQLLSITMDYEGATREYLQWLKQNPTQLGFVQGRMGTFTGKDEAREAALRVVRAELTTHPSPRLHELLAWLLMEGRDFGGAFEVYKIIDRTAKAQGASLLSFAERAFKDGVFDVAAAAYRAAMDAPVAPSRLPFATYGYALALKEMAVLSDTSGGIVIQTREVPELRVAETQGHYAGAISSFRKVIAEFPRTEFAARSHYHIGLIQFEKLFDLDGALASFEQVERDLPAGNALAHDVSLNIAKVLVVRGDTSRAAARLHRIAVEPTATPDQQDEATFRLAELEFFGGKFGSAIALLGDLSVNLKADYANDAIALQTFLQENTLTSEPALSLFARADFLARQRKITEAIPFFLDVIARYPTALLIDDALMKVGSLQARARLYTEALASYGRLLDEFKDGSIALDRARFSRGEIFELGLKDSTKAIAEYERLLVDYPESILAAQARKRIRVLRGDPM